MDTAAIDLALIALEPVDQTTSFEDDRTTRVPMLPAEQASPGKRRAAKQAPRRTLRLKGLPSVPVMLGTAALAVSVGGAVTMNEPDVAGGAPASATMAASALGGTSSTGRVSARSKPISRDHARGAQAAAAGMELKDAAEGLAKQRVGALAALAGEAEKHSKIIAKNVWQYPLASVALTARYGQYGLWASYHTGLDFNGNTGDPIHAVANGVVTSASYDGSYGNKTVVELEDGTEMWYCHQNAFGVSVGDTVRAGQIIGEVGTTGHVTGSHLHLEVRPGGGDPVDPFAAMQQHGLF